MSSGAHIHICIEITSVAQRASYVCTPCRETFFGLDAAKQRLMIGSALAAGGILAYAVHKKRQVKSIPLGEGWWGTGEKPVSEDDNVYPFQVQTSDEEIKVLLNF